MGVSKENVFILHSGSVLEFANTEADIVGEVEAGAVLVDGLGVGDVGNVVLRDRQKLADEGIVVVVIAMDNYSGQIVAGPEISTRGFVYVKEADDLLEEAHGIVEQSICYVQDNSVTDWGKIKNIIKDNLGEFIWKKTKRRPMIMPVIIEV